MGRTRLPNRRLHVTEAVEWSDRQWLCQVGFDRDGRAREVFVDGAKIGSSIEALIDDACILLSLLLQHGEAAGDVLGHLSREGTDPDAPAASLIGLLAARLAAVERDAGEGIRAAYRGAGERLAREKKGEGE